MGLFNKKNKAKTLTINRAGGEAYKVTAEMELASLLLTSFANDQFYRSAKNTYKDLGKTLAKVNPEFAAKAGIYARTEFGMRSITHVLAAELAAYASGNTWAKSFYDKIIYRPDDMMEIMSYYMGKDGKKIPNAMKKGFASAFNRFDAYQLAKYRGENKAVKLVDIANLVHPKPTEKNGEALKQLVNGELKSTGTWEAKMTKAGQVAKNEVDKATQKAQVWTDLVQSRKIGYFALLRNLRNIALQAPHLIDDVADMLVNRNAIKRSLVLPFRFVTAQDAIKDLTFDENGTMFKFALDKVLTKKKTINSISLRKQLMEALNKAIDIALDNVPVFDGRTLIVLDDSGSMTGSYGGKKSPIEIGALFAAILYKSNNADLMRFADNASYLNYNTGDATSSIASRLVKRATAGGTNFHSIFEKAKVAYDRIIILSDMQGWVGYSSPKKSFEAYKKRTGANPYVYSFDLQGYGSLQFPEHNVFALAGFSDKVFDIMKLLETDRKALINTINKVEL